MEFVNSIAKIVHMEVALHGGSANKNIGDAFLLVWKFDPDCTLRDVSLMSKGLDPKADAKAFEKVFFALPRRAQLRLCSLRTRPSLGTGLEAQSRRRRGAKRRPPSIADGSLSAPSSTGTRTASTRPACAAMWSGLPPLPSL